MTIENIPPQQDDILPKPDGIELFTTSALAEMVGTDPRTIRNAQGYGLGDPLGDGRNNLYTQQDVELLGLYVNYHNRGIPASEAAEYAKNKTGFEQQAEVMISAFVAFEQERTEESKGRILEAVASSGLFSEKERALLVSVNGLGKSLLEAGSLAGCKSEQEVKYLLAEARRKAQETFLHLIRVAT